MTTPGILQPDRRRPEPLWHQVEQAVRALIDAGKWPAGSQIPSEDRLCAMLGVSRITIRHAIRNLEASGFLRREHGRGTFVRSATLVAGARGLTSFTDEMANLGLTAGSRLLDALVVAATEDVASALEIEVGAPIVRLRRLRLGDDAPIGIQTAQLTLARVPDFLDRMPLEGSLYGGLAAHYRIFPEEARELYRVALVGEEDATLLDVPAGTPAFIVERTTSDSRGPFEFTVSLMRGDRYEIRSTLRS
ncbi:MAG: GntR family transcriptional regulator [Rhizobiales bacterium]|nr:GntR family transcriptional regulator [Hyphomicrobiales bacterium]